MSNAWIPSKCRRHESIVNIQNNLHKYYQSQSYFKALYRDINLLHRFLDIKLETSISPSQHSYPCTLLVVGPISSGKSGFISTLLRSNLDGLANPVAPSDISVCTAKFVRYHFAEIPTISIIDENNHEIFRRSYRASDTNAISDCLKDLHDLVVAPNIPSGKLASELEQYENGYYKISVGLPIELLSHGLEVVDTPAFDAQISMTEVYQQFLERIQPTICLFLFLASGALDSYLDQFKMYKKAFGKDCRFICAMNTDSNPGTTVSFSENDFQQGLHPLAQWVKRQNIIDFDNIGHFNKTREEARGISRVTVQEHSCNVDVITKDDCERLLHWLRLENDIADAIEENVIQRATVNSEILFRRISEIWKHLNQKVEQDQKLKSDIPHLKQFLDNIHKILRQHVTRAIYSISVFCDGDILVPVREEIHSQMLINEKYNDFDTSVEEMDSIKELSRSSPFRNTIIFTVNILADRLANLYCETLLRNSEFVSRMKFKYNATRMQQCLTEGPMKSSDFSLNWDQILSKIAVHSKLSKDIRQVIVKNANTFIRDYKNEFNNSESQTDGIQRILNLSHANNPQEKDEIFKRFVSAMLKRVAPYQVINESMKKICLLHLNAQIDSIRTPWDNAIAQSESKSSKLKQIQSIILPFSSLLIMKIRSFGWEFGNTPQITTFNRGTVKRRETRFPLSLPTYAHHLITVQNIFLDTLRVKGGKVNFVSLHGWNVNSHERKVSLIKSPAGLLLVDYLNNNDCSMHFRLRLCAHLLRAVSWCHNNSILLREPRPEIMYLDPCKVNSSLLLDLEAITYDNTFAKLRLSDKFVPPIHLHPTKFKENSDHYSIVSDLFACTTHIWFLICGGFQSKYIPDKLMKVSNADELHHLMRDDLLYNPFNLSKESEHLDDSHRIYQKMRACWQLQFDDDQDGILYTKILTKALDDAATEEGQSRR